MWNICFLSSSISLLVSPAVRDKRCDQKVPMTVPVANKRSTARRATGASSDSQESSMLHDFVLSTWGPVWHTFTCKFVNFFHVVCAASVLSI